MKRLLRLNSLGQSLIFWAILSVALFSMLALALDLGYTYYMRRWAQNSADSAALAAAREICINDDPATRYTLAEQAAKDYAENRNKAYGVNSQLLTDICFNGDADCPELQPGEVKTEVTIDHPALVANFFQKSNIVVPAVASAGCFAPGAAEGVLPIAWYCRRLSEDDDCLMDYINEDDTCTVGVDYMYIFFGDESQNDLLWCNGWNPPVLPPGYTPNIIWLNCDSNGDGAIDIEPVSTANIEHNWSWVDLDGGNCDATELRKIIKGEAKLNISIHTWLDECSGDKTTEYDAIYDYHIGDELVIPVFNPVCKGSYPGASCTPSVWHTKPPDDGNDTVVETAPLSSNTDWYHILTFALWRVTCVEAGGHKCTKPGDISARKALFDLNPGLIPSGYQSSVNSIEGCFIEGFNPDLIGRPSDGVDAGAWTLYLTR